MELGVFSEHLPLLLFMLLLVVFRGLIKKPFQLMWAFLSYLYVLFYVIKIDIEFFSHNFYLIPIFLLHLLVIGDYILLKKLKSSPYEKWMFIFPIFILVFFKVYDANFYFLIGTSYLSFRLLYLAYEYQQNRITLPNFKQYILFCFFPLTYHMGPINPYENHENSWNITPKLDFSFNNIERFYVGFFKLFVLTPILSVVISSNFTNSSTLLDLKNFMIYAIVNYLLIYVNFSGYCDLVITVGKVCNITIKENFKNPLTTSNLRDFWMSWHLSLTDLLREIFFTPSAIVLRRKFPHSSMLNLIVLFFIFFIIIGLWHGIGKSFILLGLFHATGMTVLLFFQRYVAKYCDNFLNSKVGYFTSWLLTQSFVAVSIVFLIKNFEELSLIFKALL